MKDPLPMSERELQAAVVQAARLLGWMVFVRDEDGGRAEAGELVGECDIPGDPGTKGRPRFHKGHAYTPGRTRERQEAYSWHLLAAKPVLNVADDLAVTVRFRCATRQRRDLDNMIKLLLDAANGIVWTDDQQVVRLDAEVERGATNPGVSFRVEVAGGRRQRCVQCGAALTRHQAVTDVRFCSPTCYGVSQRRASGARPSRPGPVSRWSRWRRGGRLGWTKRSST